jgi:hypothetical protein
VADALPVVERDVALLRPGARQIQNARTFVGIAGHEMVGDENDLAGVEQPDAKVLQDRLHAAWPARIMDHRKVDARGHDLAWAHG